MCTSKGMSQAGQCSEVAWTICAGSSLSVCLPQTSCFTLLWASVAPFLSWLITLPVKGLSRVQKPFLFHSSLLGHRSRPDSFSYFFHPTQLCDNLFCNFGCLGSSASFQQVHCMNCSTCGCSFDVLVGVDELHVLYSPILIGILPIVFYCKS